MSSVDVDIYISQVIRFFETHPDELRNLIGDLNKDDFFTKIKEISLKNHKKGDDAQLTRKQLLELVVEMNNEFKQKNKVDTIYYETIYGPICLN